MTESEKEARKRANKKYAQSHKEKINEINRRWRQSNKEKWNIASYKSRKKSALKRKELGIKYPYLPRTAREMKTILYLCKKLNINEDEAREILINYNWNMIKIEEKFLHKNRQNN